MRILTVHSTHYETFGRKEWNDVIRYMNPDIIVTDDSVNYANYIDLADLAGCPLLTGNQSDYRELSETCIYKIPDIGNIESINFGSDRQDVLVIDSISESDQISDRFRSVSQNSVILSLSDSVSRRYKTDALSPIGIGCPEENDRFYLPVTIVESDGHAYVSEVLNPKNVGVRAIKGIGRSKAKRLASSGFTSRRDLLTASPSKFLDIQGFGPHYASIAYCGAHVHERNTPFWFDENPLLGEPVAYLDIETNASRVSVIWQIGVYDEVRNEYKYFIETQKKGDPRPVPRRFARWVYEQAPDRTFVAWYGSGFDFPWLNTFIERHAEEKYANAWKNTRKIDLLQDVVRSRSCVPARSHKLDVVSGRLGYNRVHGGLSGADAARIYSQWLDGVEPDWNRWIEYCKDDVIGMKHILDRLRDASTLFDIAEIRKAYSG